MIAGQEHPVSARLHGPGAPNTPRVALGDTPPILSLETDAERLAAELTAGGPQVIVCYAKCWPCSFGKHLDPPEWHTWADDADIAHAAETGQPDRSASRCGCYCAEAPKSEPTP